MLRHLILAIAICLGGSACAIASICISCNIPDDPKDTLKEVRGGTMRVGVVENRPWVKRINDEPAGVEVELVQEFADELGAKIEWVWGPEHEILEAVKHYELDLAIGGLTKSTPWKKEVATTNSYFTNRILVGVPPSMPVIDDDAVEGVQVAVEQGDAVVAAYVKEEDAVPVFVEDPFKMNKPVAAPAWKLVERDFTVTDIELHKEKLIMAVPPGENAWLVQLEYFLSGKRSLVEKMLKQEAQS